MFLAPPVWKRCLSGVAVVGPLLVFMTVMSWGCYLDKGQSKRLFDLRMQERHARELDYLADKLGLAETAIELPMPQPPDNEGKLVSPADAWVKRMSKAQKRKVDSQSLMVS